MLTLIKNFELYSPEYVGGKDILMAGNKILKIAADIPELDREFFQVKKIDAQARTGGLLSGKAGSTFE